MFDKLWHPNLTETEALEMMRKVGAGCSLRQHKWVHRSGLRIAPVALPPVHELATWHSSQLPPSLLPQGVEEVKSRLVVAPPKYLVKVIDAKGIRTLGEL